WKEIGILITDIDSAYERNVSIHHNDFSMVSVIDSVCERKKQDFIKRKDLNSVFPETPDQGSPDFGTSEIIIKKTDFYTFFGLLNKNFFDGATGFIIFKDVVFQVDVVFGFFECLDHFREFLFAIKEQADFISLCNRTLIGGVNHL